MNEHGTLDENELCVVVVYIRKRNSPKFQFADAVSAPIAGHLEHLIANAKYVYARIQTSTSVIPLVTVRVVSPFTQLPIPEIAPKFILGEETNFQDFRDFPAPTPKNSFLRRNK